MNVEKEHINHPIKLSLLLQIHYNSFLLFNLTQFISYLLKLLTKMDYTK